MPPAAKGGGGSSAVRAGRAFVELFAQDNKLYRALDAASARLKAFGAQSAKIGLAAGAGASAVLAPLAKTFTDAVGRGAHIDKMAKRFGATTETVSALAYAFETAGVTLEEFEGTIDGLRSKIVSAADANEDVIQGLNHFRTNGRVLLAMPFEKQIDHLVDGFSRVTGPLDQATQAEHLFSAAGIKMLEVLKGGSAGLSALKAKAGPGGGLVSQADATRSTQLMKAYTEAWQGVKYTLLEVGAALLPVGDGVGSLGDRVRSVLFGVRTWVVNNKELIQTVAKVAAGVAAGGVALVAFGAVLGSVGAALGAVVTVLSGAFLPQALIAVGVGAALYSAFADTAAAGFKSFAADAADAWDGITQAMGRGDLGAAAGLGLAFVSAEWAKAVVFWTEKWNAFKDTFLDGWVGVQNRIAQLFASAVDTSNEVARLAAEIQGQKIKTVLEQVKEDQAKEAAARMKARADDLAAAERELELAKEKLRIAKETARAGDLVKAGVDAAAAGAVAAGALAAAKQQQQLKASVPNLPKPNELFNAVKGTFTLANAQMQLGYGDTAQKRQLDAALDTAKNTAVLPDIDRGIKDVGKQLVFR